MMTDAVPVGIEPSHEVPRVAILGMGYVGAVTAAALAQRGCTVTGVEINPAKLSMLQRGESPIREPGLPELIKEMTDHGRFTATDDISAAVADAEVVMVAVGTPSGVNGSTDLSSILRVADELAKATSDGRARVVMVRSTVPPGTTRSRIAPALHRTNPNTAVCHHPEFLREGSALRDWFEPAMIAYGADGAARDPVAAVIDRIYTGIDAPRVAVGTAESELLKYACNIFHAVKINFANEIGSMAQTLGADPAAVMQAFCHDTRLNISPAYLKPGFAFGGSCLPKDTRALAQLSRQQGVELPMIQSVLPSNNAHLLRQRDRILALGRKPTLLAGLTFKRHTDDLRESPMVELAEQLLGKGVPLAIFDPDLLPDELIGANAAYIQQRLPHLKLLLRRQLNEALDACEVVVIAKEIEGLTSNVLAGKTVVDLTDPKPDVTGDGELAKVA